MQKYLPHLQKFVNIYGCKVKIKVIQSFVERIGARVDVEVSLCTILIATGESWTHQRVSRPHSGNSCQPEFPGAEVMAETSSSILGAGLHAGCKFVSGYAVQPESCLLLSEGKTRQHLSFQSSASARGWSGKVHVPAVKPRFAPSARTLHISWKGAVTEGAQDVLC